MIIYIMHMTERYLVDIKLLKLLSAAFILGLFLSFAQNGISAPDNLLFRLKLYNVKEQEEAVRQAVKEYNIVSAGFYSMAGDAKEGLAVIPAAPLLKRRLFKDINMLKRDGLVMVFDRDRDEVKRVYFPRRDIAVAETFEVWAVGLQDVKTRKPAFTVKGVEVKARYLFHKEPYPGHGLRWVAYDVDVYPMDEEIPELNVKKVLLE